VLETRVSDYFVQETVQHAQTSVEALETAIEVSQELGEALKNDPVVRGLSAARQGASRAAAAALAWSKATMTAARRGQQITRAYSIDTALRIEPKVARVVGAQRAQLNAPSGRGPGGGRRAVSRRGVRPRSGPTSIRPTTPTGARS
jgi:hypothetical protein